LNVIKHKLHFKVKKKTINYTCSSDIRIGSLNIDHVHVHIADEDDSVTDVVLNDLVLPKLDTYYRYKGSLTSPPCFESITWSIFKEPILISEEQV
jgi:hypothetical protein